MQTLYLQEFELPGAWDSTKRIVNDWTSSRLGLDLAEAGHADAPDRGSTGHRHDLRGTAGTVVRWNVRQQPSEQPDWTYHVDVWMLARTQTDPSVEPECSLRCRLGVQGPAGRLVEFSQPAGAPRLVRTLLETGTVRADGRQLGRAHVVSSTDVPQLGELVLDPARRLPVVVVTPEPRTGRPVLDPQRLAVRLGGLAHVTSLAARPTTFAFTELLGTRELSVFGGAVRLYWPVAHPDHFGDPRHPLWLADRLARLGEQAFGDQLFVRLGRISALSLAEPRLEAVLLREQAEQQRGRRAARQRAVEAQLQALRDQPARTVVNEEWLEEHERVLDELESTAHERDDALDLVSRLESERDRLEAQLITHQDNLRAIAAAAPSVDPEASEPLAEEPTNVSDAVRIAASECQHLVFLPEARESAERSGFDRPQQVLDDLRALDRAAQDWRAGSLPPQGVEAVLISEGVSGFRSGVSATAHQKYVKDYRRTYKDGNVLLGPHLAHGTGAPRNIMRIYWYQDDEDRVLVVGQVGEKLRDDSNP